MTKVQYGSFNPNPSNYKKNVVMGLEVINDSQATKIGKRKAHYCGEAHQPGDV
jgi:hypothetical protein